MPVAFTGLPGSLTSGIVGVTGALPGCSRTTEGAGAGAGLGVKTGISSLVLAVSRSGVPFKVAGVRCTLWASALRSMDFGVGLGCTSVTAALPAQKVPACWATCGAPDRSCCKYIYLIICSHTFDKDIAHLGS